MVLARFAGIRPEAVLRCATPADVADALVRAGENRWPVAVRGGGHCFAGRSSSTGLVIDVSPMTGVHVAGDRAVIGAGTRLAEVYDALAAHGRTISGLTFRTVPAPDSTAFRLTYPAAAPADLLDAWQHALPELDDALAPSLVIAVPPVPAQPPTVTVFGSAPDAVQVDQLVRRLGPRPTSDQRHDGTHRATKQWLAGAETVDTDFAYLHSEYFRSVVPAAELIRRLTAHRRPGEHRELDFSPWGGAYNRVPADATAFPHRDARFLLKQTATVAPGDQPGDWLDEAYYLGNTARLHQIRRAYDPAGVFG